MTSVDETNVRGAADRHRIVHGDAPFLPGPIATEAGVGYATAHRVLAAMAAAGDLTFHPHEGFRWPTEPATTANG